MSFLYAPSQTRDDLLVHLLEDVYYAEQRLAVVMPKIIDQADDGRLHLALARHHEETGRHIVAVEAVFQLRGLGARATACPAIDAIIQQGSWALASIDDRSASLAVLIRIIQAIEHYEIHHYQTIITLVRQLGRSDIAATLAPILTDEQAASRRLSEISTTINR